MTQAYEDNVQVVSLVAGADYSADAAIPGQNRFVTIQTVSGYPEGDFLLSGAADRVSGVMTDQPDQGQPSRIVVGGVVPILLGGTVAKGGEISAGANGVGIAQASTNPSYGVAIWGGVSGDIVPMLFIPQR